jgi:hypothetical protein
MLTLHKNMATEVFFPFSEYLFQNERIFPFLFLNNKIKNQKPSQKSEHGMYSAIEQKLKDSPLHTQALLHQTSCQ